MGTMTFLLPANLPAPTERELERTCLAGGPDNPDNMPSATVVRVEPGRLGVRRQSDGSGYLCSPWDVEPFGRLMGVSATLMERSRPYLLPLELARGKVNQVRCQAADWQTGGLVISPDLSRSIHDASRAFGQALLVETPHENPALSQGALQLGYRAADQLVAAYVEQVFQIRHQRQERLDTQLGCRITAVPPPPLDAALKSACNALTVPLPWSAVEAAEGVFHWEATDAVVDWAMTQGVEVTAGPLIDFSSAYLPAWLWRWERDVPTLATFMGRYVEAAVRRYRNRVRRWMLTTAANAATLLSLREDELLGLTYRLGEAARQIDSGIALVVGVVLPWGDYMARESRQHSPFIFADTLIRSGLNLAALDLEIVMGPSPRGSYCRDLLETSRLLDLYALLGVDLRVTLGYPADPRPDPDADPDLLVDAGRWRDGYSPDVQARWASAFANLVTCKPFVRGLTWAQFSDAAPHQFPHCGLVDRAGQVRPALAALRELRARHLA